VPPKHPRPCGDRTAARTTFRTPRSDQVVSRPVGRLGGPHHVRVYDAVTRQMSTPATYVASPPAARPVLALLYRDSTVLFGNRPSPDEPTELVALLYDDARAS